MLLYIKNLGIKSSALSRTCQNHQLLVVRSVRLRTPAAHLASGLGHHTIGTKKEGKSIAPPLLISFPIYQYLICTFPDTLSVAVGVNVIAFGTDP